MIKKLKENIIHSLYSFDFIRNIKEKLRPVKHSIFGKDGIYFVADEVAFVRAGISPIKVVFDIGAAYGDMARTLAHFFPEAEIYCFEPQKESMQHLMKRTHSFKERVKTFSVAFLNKTGTEMFNVFSYRDASSFLPLQSYFECEGVKKVETRAVSVIKLDDFIQVHNIHHIDFLKIDVEGVEKELLEGGSETLRNMVDNVFIEISSLRQGPHSADYIEVFKFFHERGFTFMGCYGDYFFSKDRFLLEKYFRTKK